MPRSLKELSGKEKESLDEDLPEERERRESSKVKTMTWYPIGFLLRNRILNDMYQIRGQSTSIQSLVD